MNAEQDAYIEEQRDRVLPAALRLQWGGALLFLLFVGWDIYIFGALWTTVLPFRLICVAAHASAACALATAWGQRHFSVVILMSSFISMPALSLLTTLLPGGAQYLPLLLTYYLIGVLGLLPALTNTEFRLCLAYALIVPLGLQWFFPIRQTVLVINLLVWAPLLGFCIVTGTQIQRRALAAWQLQRQLDQLATTDPLTGCGNRRRIFQQLEDEVARYRRYPRGFSVLMIDLDFFKRINDEYGHASGDATLQATVALFQSVLRSSDALGRTGGEEFLVLLPEVELAIASELAERLRSAVAEAASADQPVIRCTVSIGVAAYAAGETAADLLGRADQALYQAKTLGRNRVANSTSV